MYILALTIGLAQIALGILSKIKPLRKKVSWLYLKEAVKDERGYIRFVGNHSLVSGIIVMCIVLYTKNVERPVNSNPMIYIVLFLAYLFTDRLIYKINIKKYS